MIRQYTNMVASLAPTDFLLVWGLPLAALVATWLTLSLAVFVALKSRREFAFKSDLLRRQEGKRDLPSGRKLTFGYVALLLLADNCVQATLLYRASRYVGLRRMTALAQGLHAFAKFLTHVDVSPWADIGPGFYLYHGLGTVIGKGTTIGSRALICQGVTIGGGPSVGDDVRVWAGAKVIGRITVGDGAEIGANAVVIRDVPPGCLAVGVPARIVREATDSPMPADGAGAASESDGRSRGGHCE